MDAAMPMHEQAARSFAGTEGLRPGVLGACPDTGVGFDRAPGVPAHLARRRRR